MAVIADATSTATGNEGDRYLTLAGAIEAALANNTDVKIEQINEGIAFDRIALAASIFDPELRGSYRYESIDRPQNRQDLVATGGGDLLLDSPRIFEERNHRFDSGIGKKTPWGTDLELGTTWSRLDNTLNRDVPPSLFNPEYTTFTGLTVTQPLLRDFGPNVNLTSIQIARKEADIASLNWLGQVQATVAGVVKRYVDLASAYRSLKVRDEAIALAQKLVEDNQARRDQGKMTDVDVQEAEVAVSIRQEERISADTDYVERLNALRVLINPVDDPMVGGRIVPTTPFQTWTPEMDRDDLMSMAKENRDDYEVARLELEREESRVEYALNQKKPRVDLQASVGSYGLDGDFSGTYGESFSGQGPEWSVGVQVSIPLGNRQAKQQLAIARKQAEQARLKEARLDLVVALELDTVLNRIETAAKRLETAKKTSELSQSFLESEAQRMKEGKSTSFQVLEKQTDLSASRTRELIAAADLQKAIVDLWVVTGTVLDQYNVSVADRVGSADKEGYLPLELKVEK
ncbi:MAG: TolC family protein [Verrucomicrobiae bacterium]|nr:TolC family protein [Verrucomicrobiae bacterium]